MASYYLKGYTTPDGVNSRADVREWQNKLGVKADGIWAVSYTHLDVYKRQFLRRSKAAIRTFIQYLSPPGIRI